MNWTRVGRGSVTRRHRRRASGIGDRRLHDMMIGVRFGGRRSPPRDRRRRPVVSRFRSGRVGGAERTIWRRELRRGDGPVLSGRGTPIVQTFRRTEIRCLGREPLVGVRAVRLPDALGNRPVLRHGDRLGYRGWCRSRLVDRWGRRAKRARRVARKTLVVGDDSPDRGQDLFHRRLVGLLVHRRGWNGGGCAHGVRRSTGPTAGRRRCHQMTDSEIDRSST